MIKVSDRGNKKRYVAFISYVPRWCRPGRKERGTTTEYVWPRIELKCSDFPVRTDHAVGGVTISIGQKPTISATGLLVIVALYVLWLRLLVCVFLLLDDTPDTHCTVVSIPTPTYSWYRVKSKVLGRRRPLLGRASIHLRRQSLLARVLSIRLAFSTMAV